MRYCRSPECHELVESGFCAAHRSEGRKWRPGRAEGYDSRWDEASLRFRRRFPLCGMRLGGARPILSQCFERGLTTPAEEVDHVIPHRGDRALFWNEQNWQSLCGACHRRKTKAGL